MNVVGPKTLSSTVTDKAVTLPCTKVIIKACYGIVTVPTGPWFCRKCESQERAARVKNKLRESLTIRNFQQRCELCPSKDGALKRTDNGGWAHVVCALYIPEVRFGNVTTMEPIILQLVPPERFNKSCYICEEQGKESRSTVGACMQCNKSGCKQHFHVTCAQAAGLLCEEAGNYMDNVKYCGYCQYHYQKLRLSSIRSGLLGKKGNSIKTIPAFKPIPADNATPDSTPEKNSPPLHDGIKEKMKLARHERRAVKNGLMVTSSNVMVEPLSATSFSDNSNSSMVNLNSNRADGGNSVIVSSSGGNLVGKFTTANFTETVITHSGSVFGSAEKVSKKKKNSIGSCNNFNRTSLLNSTNSMGMGSLQNMDGEATGDDDVSFSTSDTGSETVKTTVSDSALAEKNAASSSLLGATPSGSFTSAYEDFLSGSYPGITSDADGSSKRQRSQSSDRLEKKKHKKGSGAASKKNKKKKEMAANGVGLEFANMIYGGGADHNYFRSYSSSAANSNGMISAQELAANQSMFFPTSSLEGSKKALGEEKNAPQVEKTESVHLPENHEMPLPHANGSMPSFVNMPRFGMGAASSGRNGPSSTTSQFPQSLEQLLERQWEQGSQFLMEQSQHFDIASLLSCLHQLRVENHRLEEHVGALVSRRDHLLAVNARLSMSLSTTHPAASSLTDASRISRVNSFIPNENAERAFQHRSPSHSVSPGHAASPAMNSLHSLISGNSSTPPHSMTPSSIMGMIPQVPHPSSLMQSVIGQHSPLVSHHGHMMNSASMNGSPSIRCSSAQSSYLSTCPSSHSSLPSPLMSHSVIESSEHLRLQQQANSSSPYPLYPGIPNATYVGMPNSGQSTMTSSTPVSVVMSVTAQQAHSHASGKKNKVEMADHNNPSVSDKR